MKRRQNPWRVVHFVSWMKNVTKSKREDIFRRKYSSLIVFRLTGRSDITARWAQHSIHSLHKLKGTRVFESIVYRSRGWPKTENFMSVEMKLSSESITRFTEVRTKETVNSYTDGEKWLNFTDNNSLSMFEYTAWHEKLPRRLYYSLSSFQSFVHLNWQSVL